MDEYYWDALDYAEGLCMFDAEFSSDTDEEDFEEKKNKC